MRNIKLLQLIILIGLIIGVNACTTMPAYPGAYNQPMSWRARRTQLNRIHHWQLEGAIAIKTPQKTLSAYLNWQQFSSHYQLTLFGPFGIGTVTMKGSKNQFSLQTPDRKIYRARNPETLIRQQLGWTLPVSNLYFWIRGLPAPHHNAQKRFDAYHHLTALKQQGWSIEYLKYTGIHGTDLPTKIILMNANIKLRIVISQWKF